MKAHNKTLKFFTHAGLMLCMMLFLSITVFAYAPPNQAEYPEIHYDTGKTARVTDLNAKINETGDMSLLCTIPSKDLTAPPYIITVDDERYFLTAGTDFIEMRNDQCTNIADITLGDDLTAPAIMYYYDDNWSLFAPLKNKSIEEYIFNGTAFISKQSFVLASDVNNSFGSCADIDGVDYCFWQNTTNDLERITLSTGTVTPFTVMSASAEDTSERQLLIRTTSTAERVIITGRDGIYTGKLCSWHSATEAVEWGGCITLYTSSAIGAGANVISNPVVYDIDGGSSNEIAVAHMFTTGTGVSINFFTTLSVYGASGSLKYSATKTQASGTNIGNRRQNLYNPVPVIIDTGTATSSFYFCTIGELESSLAGTTEDITLLCTGLQGDISVEKNTLTQCTWDGTDAGMCYWMAGVFDSDEGSVNQTESSLVRNTLIGHNKFIGLDLGTTDFTDKGFEYAGQYWTAGDVDQNYFLDLIYNIGTDVFVRLGLVVNENPQFTAYPSVAIDGDLPLCENDTYYVSTITNDAYFDADAEQVRLAVDCDTDGVIDDYSDWGTSGIDNLNAECSWTIGLLETGSYTLTAYLQDAYLATANTTSTSIRTLPVQVTDDTDICSVAGSGISYDTTYNETNPLITGTTPSQSLGSVFAGFGLSGAWLTVVWLIIMAGVTIGLVSIGMTNPYVIGMMNLFMLILGNIFGAVSVWVTVLIGLVLGVIGAITIFAGGG